MKTESKMSEITREALKDDGAVDKISPDEPTCVGCGGDGNNGHLCGCVIRGRDVSVQDYARPGTCPCRLCPAPAVRDGYCRRHQ